MTGSPERENLDHKFKVEGGGKVQPTVCVQGLGFVGAVMAVAVAAARQEDGRPCFSVVGIDLPTPQCLERIEQLNRGVFPFGTTDESLIRAAISARTTGNLSPSSDPSSYSDADVILVDVHLDVGTTGEVPDVDFTGFRRAITTIGSRMKPGALVIVETTVPPGTCREVVAPALRAALEERGLPPESFHLAHSYERVMPGKDYLESITNFWRVYAGHTPEAADRCEQFLSQVINVDAFPLTRLHSTTASEMAKVIENSYRATTIAFVEEWARFAEAVDVDLFEIVRAIRQRPTHSNMRQPGFGVGGYCLTKDPLFGGIAARTLFGRPDLQFPFAEMAIRTNQAMPIVSVERLQEVADTRYSPSQIFVEEALARGATVVAHDPLVREWPEAGMRVESAIPAAETVDAVVFALSHQTYRELSMSEWLGKARPAILDANAVFTPEQRLSVRQVGCAFAAIGEG